jgi:hypothetical protein
MEGGGGGESRGQRECPLPELSVRRRMILVGSGNGFDDAGRR